MPYLDTSLHFVDSKGMDEASWNLDLKYFINEDSIFYTHCSDPFEL